MNIDNRWILLLALAASAAASAAFASNRSGRHRRHAHLEHKQDLKSWENEGGNLAPVRASQLP